MPTRRQYRYNEMLLEELSLLVPGRLGDEDLSDVSLTRVECAQDLSTAKVWFTLGADSSATDIADALARLQEVQGQLMDELTTLGLRRIPRLVFGHDKAHESGQRVLDILARLERGETDAGGPGPGTGQEG